jgi:hypothetical protein
MPHDRSDAELIGQAMEDRLLDVHTALPAIVKSYDAETQTVSAEPAVQRAGHASDGGTVHVTLPVCQFVPVCWPNGGGYYLHFPITAGDSVMLIFSEAAWAQYRESGALSPPGDLRRHSLGYACAIPMNPVTSRKFTDAPPNEGVLIVGPGGSLRVSTAGGAAEFVALATLVQARLDGLQSAISGWVPVANDGGLALQAALATWLGTPNDVAATTLKAE